MRKDSRGAFYALVRKERGDVVALKIIEDVQAEHSRRLSDGDAPF